MATRSVMLCARVRSRERVIGLGIAAIIAIVIAGYMLQLK